MKDFLLKSLKEAFEEACQQGDLPTPQWPSSVQLDSPKQRNHGDFATNLAIVYANQITRGELKSRSVAEKIIPHLSTLLGKEFRMEIAGAGFINFFMDHSVWAKEVLQICREGKDYGLLDRGQGQKIQVEFVSANPTGPLHVGHARNAVVGDALARALKKSGYQVTRTFYINDVGVQMRALGLSLFREQQALVGQVPSVVEWEYKGEYVKELAKALQEETRNPIFGSAEELEELGRMGAERILKESIQPDLEEFRVHFEEWHSEKRLYEEKKIQEAIDRLIQSGHTYTQEGALWFRSTDFKDDKDRVLVRANGVPTYFASDVAYHLQKFEEGYDLYINIWGADHHGYPARIRGALQALGQEADRLKVVFIQLVRLVRGEQVVPMSKRQGDYVTLRDLIDEVGVDAVRFFLLLHHSDSALDFDIELAKKKTADNPVFYVQYAHARICSVFRKAQEEGIVWNPQEALMERLSLEEENQLVRKLAQFPERIELIAKTLEPHVLTYYLQELAVAFHRYYTEHRIVTEDVTLSQARLSLLRAIQVVLQNGLEVIGVVAPERM
ncbi:MAG: arginine--tRNA ligase [Deltaproteobacteria bacterium]|nr:arginine--tRNA ligase [Deltaproteobacteria bacterium]